MSPPPLLPAVLAGEDREAIRVGERALTYAGLRAAAGSVAARVAGHGPVAVWATPELETCVAVVGALLAGVPWCRSTRGRARASSATWWTTALPASSSPPPAPSSPTRWRGWSASTWRPSRARRAATPCPSRTARRRPSSSTPRARPGRPRGPCSRAGRSPRTSTPWPTAWAWTGDDVLAHALPLFHVHGLILGVLGPLRLAAPSTTSGASTRPRWPPRSRARRR